LTTEQFDTESGFDFLTVNGQEFSGSHGPGTVEFEAGAQVSVSWRSDGSVTDGGWNGNVA